jgi:hypothetical protein
VNADSHVSDDVRERLAALVFDVIALLAVGIVDNGQEHVHWQRTEQAGGKREGRANIPMVKNTRNTKRKKNCGGEVDEPQA